MCGARGLWHHVDGAYGAFFHLVEPLRPLLAGLPRADSLTLDPHKGLFLPYGTGALLVRDGAALRAVHEVDGRLPAAGGRCRVLRPGQHGPELSRGFPGLRVWLTVKLFGAARLRAAIAEKRALAVLAAEALARVPGIVLVAPPQLSLFAFRLDLARRPRRRSRTRRRARCWSGSTRAGRVMLTGCTAGGRFLGRDLRAELPHAVPARRGRRGADRRGGGDPGRAGPGLRMRRPSSL